MSDHYQEALNQVFNSLVGEVKSLLKLLPGSDDAAKQASRQKLTTHVQDMMRIIPTTQHPPWLRSLNSQLQSIKQKDYPSLCLQLAEHVGKFTAYDYRQQTSDGTCDFDFDAIFERLREESNITDLFDSMIGIIADMVASDEIESVYVLDALSRLQSVLEANRKGSFASIWAVIWNVEFCKKAVAKYAQASKYTKPLWEAFDEMKSEMKKLQSRLHRDSTALVIDEKTLGRLRRLEGNEQLMLPSIDDASNDAEIEDVEFEVKGISEPTALD